MKRFTLLALSLLCLACAWAQSNIFFSLKPVQASSTMSEEVANALNTRVRQILNRNSAAAADMYNPFMVEPILSIVDISSTQGLIQNVTLAKGELTLIALNAYDGAEYYSKTINISAEVTSGDREKAMLALVNGIKLTDSQWTRFIRVSREKIAQYFTENCSAIIQRSETMIALKQYQEAVNYLQAVPSVAPCFSDAQELIKGISSGNDKQPETVPETAPEPQPEPEPEAVSEPEPVAEAAPQAAAPQCEITISSPNWSFKVLSCTGDWSRRMITITVKIENISSQNRTSWLTFSKAFTPDGVQLGNLGLINGSRQEFPSKLAVKRQFTIEKLSEMISELAYAQIIINDSVSVQQVQVEIRNLKIDWQ